MDVLELGDGVWNPRVLLMISIEMVGIVREDVALRVKQQFHSLSAPKKPLVA